MRRNIAIIIPTLTGGGAERVAGYLSEHLAEKYNVYLFVYEKSENSYSYAGQVTVISEVFKDGVVSNVEALKCLKRRYSIDVSISFMEYANYVNIMSKCEDRVIISERTTIAYRMPRRAHSERLIRELYPYADEVVTCSYGICQSLVNRVGLSDSNLSVIYNFIDCDRVRKMAREPIDNNVGRFLEGSEYFISVGRLEKVKRHDYLIYQFYEFHKNASKDYKLIILGSGSNKDRLEELIHNLGMESSIRIIPYINNPFPYILRAKAFIHVSTVEGFPNVILEAMTLAVPVISTDCRSGPREILLGENDYEEILKYPVKNNYGFLIENVFDTDYSIESSLPGVLEWVDRNEEYLPAFRNSEIKRMEEYSNKEILDQWITLIEKPEKNGKKYIQTALETLDNAKHIYIYGAGTTGKRIFESIYRKYSIEGFIISDYSERNANLNGVPIINCNDVDLSRSDTAVIIGVGMDKFDEVYDILIKKMTYHIVEMF